MTRRAAERSPARITEQSGVHRATAQQLWNGYLLPSPHCTA